MSSSIRLPTITALLAAFHTFAAAPAFHEDFTQTEPGRPPESLMVIEGQFTVAAEGENKFLELPGAPLESYCLMFGPAQKEDWGAQARIHGIGKGRKFPVFGVSINGMGGYRLYVAPAKKAIELLKGDRIHSSVPFAWESDSWTQIRIQVRKTGDATWKIEGKAWKDGTPEPESWMITADETQTPLALRAAVWGMPYAGTPIRFDDLKVLPAQ